MELPERVASDLHVIAENIESLRDSVQELYILLEYVYRNREELLSLLQPKEGSVEPNLNSSELIPFTLACTQCDADSPTSQAEAISQGWTRISEDLHGLSWNYVGICPDCGEAEAEEESEDDPVRGLYECLVSMTNKANELPYVPLSQIEQYLLIDQKLMTRGGKLTAKGKAKFRELDAEKRAEAQREEAQDIAETEGRKSQKRIFE